MNPIQTSLTATVSVGFWGTEVWRHCSLSSALKIHFPPRLLPGDLDHHYNSQMLTAPNKLSRKRHGCSLFQRSVPSSITLRCCPPVAALDHPWLALTGALCFLWLMRVLMGCDNFIRPKSERCIFILSWTCERCAPQAVVFITAGTLPLFYASLLIHSPQLFDISTLSPQLSPAATFGGHMVAWRVGPVMCCSIKPITKTPTLVTCDHC